MRGSFKIGRIAGIEIGIHYTWLIAFVLFAWLFAQLNLPFLFPGWTTAQYWIAGTSISFLIFVSVLAHELCHSLVAIKRGMNVSSIVFFIFGGVSNIEREPGNAWEEFIMAGAGPASSLVISGLFFAGAYVTGTTGSGDSILYGILIMMANVNLILAVFNMIPGFPLDGGRVFRSIIWGITKNLHTATLIAGNTGRVFGWAMILFGVASMFGIRLGDFYQGGLFNGIWLILIGWFLNNAADNAIREETLQKQLAGVKVKDVMDRYPECASPSASVYSVVHDSFIQRGRRALPICSESGLLGIVTLADVRRIPQEQWQNTPVQEIMTRSPLESVNQNDDLNNALRALAKGGLNQIPVMEDGQMVGLLSRADVIRYLQTRQELGIKPDRDLRFMD